MWSAMAASSRLADVTPNEVRDAIRTKVKAITGIFGLTTITSGTRRTMPSRSGLIENRPRPAAACSTMPPASR